MLGKKIVYSIGGGVMAVGIGTIMYGHYVCEPKPESVATAQKAVERLSNSSVVYFPQNDLRLVLDGFNALHLGDSDLGRAISSEALGDHSHYDASIYLARQAREVLERQNFRGDFMYDSTGGFYIFLGALFLGAGFMLGRQKESSNDLDKIVETGHVD